MQGIKRKRRCESQCKQHIFSLKYLKTSSKYDIKMNFCPKYQRQPLPPEQTFAQFNNDRLYYTSAFVIGIDKKVVAKNLQKEMLDHQKLIKQCCEKYNPVIFPRPNSKHFLCSVCKQNYKNYYVHIFSPEHSYKVNENNYNDSIKQLCQKFRQLWEGAQQKADEQQERRKQQLQMELNDQEEGQYQQQQVEENFEEQNEENKLQNGYRQYSQQKQKQIVLKKIQSAVTSKPPKQIKQKDSNKRSSAPFLFQQIPKKKICLNDRNPSTSQSRKKQQVQNSQFNQQKLQKTVPNNQEAFISARGQQQQRLKQLLAGERSKDPRLQKFSQRSTRNQALGKKQTNQINYTQFYEKGQQRLKNQRIRMEQRQYNSRRFITEKQLFKLHQYNEMQNQKNRFNENQKKNNQRKPQKDKFYQGIDLVQSNSRNNPNDSNQDKRFQMDHYRSKQHHDAEDSKKSINQISNRSRNAELSRKMSDNFKDKNLPFQNPYYKYQSYYSPHPAHIYGGYYPPYGAQLQKLDPYRKHSDRQNANSSQIRYDHRMYYPVWQPPPPQYCMPPPVIVQRSNPPAQNGKSQQGYSSSYPMPQYQSNNFRQTEYVPHPYSNAHRQGPNTSININFPMYMAYPPNYYSSAQPPRYSPSLNQDNFTTSQQMGQPVYRNYQEQPYYYQQRNSYQQKKQYRQEKR